MNTNYKALLRTLLDKYGYFIYEITVLDRYKNVYIGSREDNKVAKCVTGTNYRDILANVAYNLAMYGVV